MDADDEREEELSTIAAIFPEIQISPSNPFLASLEIPVELSSALQISFPPLVNGAPPANPPPTDDGSLPIPIAAKALQETHKLTHLPPLSLTIRLPEGYPATKPLEALLSTNPAWLSSSRLKELEKEAENVWNEYGRSQSVFAYIDLIQQAAERGFDLGGDDDTPLELPAEMKVALLDFDKKAQREKFEQGTYDCGVCLEPKKGLVCHRIRRCGHVFCVSCLKDFYTSAIQEGDVTTVRCLDPTCGNESPGARRRAKKQRTLGPSELLQIPLDHMVVKRYVELKRKKKLESDKSTVYCPRKWCQGPARSKKYPKITSLDQYESSESETEPSIETPPLPIDPSKPPKKEDRLAVCEDCDFAFCRVCLASWHGEFVKCWPRSAEELTEEEQASYNYIRLRTSACPTCDSPSQKTHGCNHMTCFQCRTHFCYLCTSWLDPSNPYEHFNNPKKECYMRLWELEEGDEGQEVRFDGIRGAEHAALRAAQEDFADEPDAPHAAQIIPPAGEVPPEAPVPPPAANPPLIMALRELRIAAPPVLAPQPRGARRGGGRGRGAPPAQAPRGRGRGRGGRVQQNQRQQGVVPNVPVQVGQVDGAADLMGNRGLQRFLQMAANDEEDEWDSDELEGDDAEFAQFR